jgi:hypothetical protein
MQADKTKDTETERSIDDTQRIFGDILSAELDPFFSGERFSEDGMETHPINKFVMLFILTILSF